MQAPGPKNHYLFQGVIHPLMDPFQLRVPCRLRHTTGEFSVVIQFDTGKLDVPDFKIEVETDSDADIYTIRNVIQRFCHALTDGIGYLEGIVLQLCFDRQVLHNGSMVQLAAGPPALIEARSQRPFAGDYESMIRSLSSPPLIEALANYREAMHRASDTGMFCFRAIECLRQSFHTKDPDRKESSKHKKQSWRRLGESLRIDKTWFDEIRHYAEFQRHGADKEMSDSVRGIFFERTVRVIDRFCLFVTEPSKLDGMPILACDNSSIAATCLGDKVHKNEPEDDHCPGCVCQVSTNQQ